MPNSITTAQVSDTTMLNSSNTVGSPKKIFAQSHAV